MICRPRCSQERLPEVRCPYSASIQSKGPKPAYELWYMSSSVGVQSGSEVQQPKKESCQLAHVKSQVTGSSKTANIV